MTKGTMKTAYLSHLNTVLETVPPDELATVLL